MTDPDSGNSVAAQRLAAKGMVPKQAITAVLLKSTSSWLEIIPGTFDICEINFLDEATGATMGGVVGFKFAAKGVKGRAAVVFTQMDCIAAIQLEEPENPGGGQGNTVKAQVLGEGVVPPAPSGVKRK